MVKPISAQVRSHIDTSYPQYKSQPFSQEFLYENQDFVLEKRRTTENDDYEFLDEFESLDDDDVMRSSNQRRRRQKRSQSDLVSNFHVVFQRKDNHLNSHPSDYGKQKLSNTVQTQCVKITQNVAFEILAFSTYCCQIKIELSGNTVWPQASGFQKLAEMDHLWYF